MEPPAFFTHSIKSLFSLRSSRGVRLFYGVQRRILIHNGTTHRAGFILDTTPNANRCSVDAPGSPDGGGSPEQVLPCDEVKSETLPELFESEETRLLRYAFSLTGRRAVAEDIVQDVFLKLHLNWDRVETPRAWLVRSVRNRALDHLRNQRREVLRGDDPEANSPDSAEEAHADHSPQQAIQWTEATDALRALVEQLDEPDRRLVTLKYFDDLSYRDISDATGLSIGNVGYRLHHVLKKLAVHLRPLGIDCLS